MNLFRFHFSFSFFQFSIFFRLLKIVVIAPISTIVCILPAGYPASRISRKWNRKSDWIPKRPDIRYNPNLNINDICPFSVFEEERLPWGSVSDRAHPRYRRLRGQILIFICQLYEQSRNYKNKICVSKFLCSFVEFLFYYNRKVIDRIE